MKRLGRTRTYRQGLRAELAAETHRAILEAALQKLSERPYDEVSLADIARAADVTVQTVLRRFGSKEGLTEAAAALGGEEVRRARMSAPVGDVEAAVKGLVEHYEAWGERSLTLLAQEQRVAAVRSVVEAGRALHYEWVEHAFAPWLAQARGAVRTRLRARLIAVTDVYVWKVLRKDLGLDVRVTQATLRELVESNLASSPRAKAES